MKAKTVLILGAGASHGYGFPLGYELSQRIIELQDNSRASDCMGFGPMTVRNFVSSFHLSQSNSIDQFLGRRPEFAEVGKAAIAYVLLRCEQKSDVFDLSISDHWYKYLLNQITTDDWDSFDPSWLSVVSFNYDRSLLHFLETTLRHHYRKDRLEVLERLKKMQFVHVYGSLGDLLNGLPFGGFTDPDGFADSVQAAAKGLLVIPEGRDDADSVVKARTLISEASKIGFLGFGFDQTNIRRLGAPNCFLADNSTRSVPKTTIATCKGLYASERSKAISSVFGSFNHFYLDEVTNRFFDDNCINTLRKSLLLD